MNIAGRNLWQVAAGDTDRSYEDVLLDWDVIAYGPGSPGPWPANVSAYQKSVTTQLNRLSSMNPGDLIILRVGTSNVYGVGEVVDNELLWLDDFGDIDGWDLQHIRRVRWLWRYDQMPARLPRVFPSYALNFGATIQRITTPHPMVSAFLQQDVSPTPTQMTRSLVALPASCISGVVVSTITFDSVLGELGARGVGSIRLGHLRRALDEAAALARWYLANETTPREHEGVAHLVVPLLLALGWTRQECAIERMNVDVTLFGGLRDVAHLLVLGEVKRFDQSCLTAKEQAIGYFRKCGAAHCRMILLTDGVRYGLLRPQGEQWQMDAYLNILHMRREYPIFRCQGAPEALAALLKS